MTESCNDFVSLESLVEYLQETFPSGTRFVVRDMDYGCDMGPVYNPQPNQCLARMNYLLPDGTMGSI